MQQALKVLENIQAARAIHKRVVDEAHLGYSVAAIQDFSNQITRHLSAANKNFRVLDPKGEKSHRQMVASLRDTFSKCHLYSARSLFREIELGARKPLCSSHLLTKVRHIQEHMAFVRINGRKPEDWACLDEEGRSSGQDIKNRITNALNLADNNASALFRRMTPQYGLAYRPR